MKHKAYTLSALQDSAPPNYRTTKCGGEIKNTEVSTTWNKVTCKVCLEYQVKRKGNIGVKNV